MLSPTPLRALFLGLSTAFLITPVAQPQGRAPTPRIVSAIDENSLRRLDGNVPHAVSTAIDQGEADSATQLTHIRLVLSRTPAQEAALDRYLAELQDKSSPNFHKWLTPERFGALYGPADADIETLTSWLESHGLKVESASKGRTNIAFAGSVADVEETFHVSVHSFTSIYGEQFYSNTTDPRIPSALATVVSGVARLNTIHPRAHSDRGPAGSVNPKSNHLEPIHLDRAAKPNPLLTVGSDFLYLVPGDAATIYDTPNTTFNANYTSGTTYDGTGVKIGIGGESLIQGSTVADYRSMFLGNTTQPSIVNVDNVTSSTNTGALDEAYIDTELSGGLAPGASIVFYTSSDLVSAIEAAVNDNTVDIFSLSFGECELDMSTSDNAQFKAWWQQAAGEGMTITVSSGDNGSAACDATQTSGGANVTAAVGGLAVNGFASTPYNIAVGGTDFYPLTGSFSTYVSTSQGSSSTFYRSALGPIPESTWNDSSTTDTTIADDVPWTGAEASNANIVAGSGGKSSCSTNTTVDTSTTYTVGSCTSGYAKPTWQTGTGIPGDSVRDLPDVSLMAGNGFDSATWLICSDDTTKNSGGTTVSENCTKQSDGNVYFVGYGGTSTASPAFAGILALVVQKTGGRLGQAAQNLYTLYKGANASTIFHNLSVGNNSVPCTSGKPNCVKNTGGYYYLSGYNTSNTYNLGGGLGSVDAKLLLNNWSSSVTGTTAPTIAVTPSLTTLPPATALTVAVTVTGSGSTGTPTGAVSLSGGGYTSPAETLTAGAYTFNLPAGTLDVGADTLTVLYSGDTNYSSVSGTTTVTVTGLTPTVTVTPSTASITANNTVTLAVAVTGTGAAPTGTVALSGAYTIAAQTLSGGAFSFSVPANTLATGSDQFTVTYSGDTNYASATGTATVTVAASTATFTLAAGAASPATVTAGQSSSANVTVGTTNGYGGTVVLACALTSGPTNTSGDAPSCLLTTSGVAVGSSTPVTVQTIAAVSTELTWPHFGGRDRRWAGAGGGAVLALLFFFGIPARRRKWTSMLGMILALTALGSLAACGGGGGGGTTTTNPGTAAGTYTFSVTGTGTPAPASAAAAATFTVVVN